MKIYFCFSLAFTLFVSSYSSASKPEISKTIELSSQQSKIEFIAVGRPSMLKINGTGAKLNDHVDFKGLNVSAECVVPLDSITTGIDLRDTHMKTKYLESAKFPDATLTISNLVLEKNFLIEKGIQKNIPFKGKLKIHGEESDVEGLADVMSDEKSISIQATTKTNITAHKIDLPSYLGVKVADQVEIKADLKIIK